MFRKLLSSKNQKKKRKKKTTCNYGRSVRLKLRRASVRCSRGRSGLPLRLIQTGNALARCHLFNLKTSTLTLLLEPDTAPSSLPFTILHSSAPPLPSSPWEQLDKKRERRGERERESHGIPVFNSADEGRLPGAMVRGFFGITALRTVGRRS